MKLKEYRIRYKEYPTAEEKESMVMAYSEHGAIQKIRFANDITFNHLEILEIKEVK